jgi:preprotein translocase subunit SecG
MQNLLQRTTYILMGVLIMALLLSGLAQQLE